MSNKTFAWLVSRRIPIVESPVHITDALGHVSQTGRIFSFACLCQFFDANQDVQQALAQDLLNNTGVDGSLFEVGLDLLEAVLRCDVDPTRSPTFPLISRGY